MANRYNTHYTYVPKRVESLTIGRTKNASISQPIHCKIHSHKVTHRVGT